MMKAKSVLIKSVPVQILMKLILKERKKARKWEAKT
jgi:hypothetical protein